MSGICHQFFGDTLNDCIGTIDGMYIVFILSSCCHGFSIPKCCSKKMPSPLIDTHMVFSEQFKIPPLFDGSIVIQIFQLITFLYFHISAVCMGAVCTAKCTSLNKDSIIVESNSTLPIYIFSITGFLGMEYTSIKIG